MIVDKKISDNVIDTNLKLKKLQSRHNVPHINRQDSEQVTKQRDTHTHKHVDTLLRNMTWPYTVTRTNKLGTTFSGLG